MSELQRVSRDLSARLARQQARVLPDALGSDPAYELGTVAPTRDPRLDSWSNAAVALIECAWRQRQRGNPHADLVESAISFERERRLRLASVQLELGL